MNKSNQIRCVSCRFARQDKAASVYTRKQCKNCELNADCTCQKKICKCGKGCKFRNTDTICQKQQLNWKAIECGCSYSEYYKSLLNVTPSGDMQERITWSGCSCGERRERL